MSTTIGEVEFIIEIHEPRRRSPWFTATWECKSCGARGVVSESNKQNTYGGASNAATGEARWHVKDVHKDIA